MTSVHIPVDRDIIDFISFDKKDQLILIEIAKKLRVRNISLEELKKYLENIDYKITVEDRIAQLERRVKIMEEKILQKPLTKQEMRVLNLAKTIGFDETIRILENELKSGEKLPDDAIKFLEGLLNTLGIKAVIRVEKAKEASKAELVRAIIKAEDPEAYEKYRIYEIKVDWGTEPGYKLLLAHIYRMLIKQYYEELKKLGVTCDYIDAWWKSDKPHKKVKGATVNLLLAKAKTIDELWKREKEIISKIYEISKIIPPATVWKSKEIYSYLDECKRSNKYTYVFFKILASKDKPITKEQLMEEMSRQLQEQIKSKQIPGIKAGIAMTTDRLNKESLIRETTQGCKIRDKYRTIIQQYFTSSLL